MGDLYNRIETSAKARGFKNVSQLCEVAGVPRANLTELKKGRAKTLSQKTMQKLCDALGMTMDELYGREPAAEKTVTDDDLKFALFGGDGEITDEMFAEVKAFAEFVKMKNKKEKRD